MGSVSTIDRLAGKGHVDERLYLPPSAVERLSGDHDGRWHDRRSADVA